MPRSALFPTIGTAALVVFTVLQASCFSERSIYTLETEVTAEGDIIQKPREVNLARHRELQQAQGPRVRVDHTVHDFGLLDPLTKHQHTFTLYNDGDEPLELEEGPTTCKCTVANLVTGNVPPGGKAHVVMQWNTGRDLEYAHSATIYTNDPRNRIVRLQIKGRVQVLFRAEPAELVFSRVEPGETPSASAVVYSQIWDQLELTECVPSLPGVQWREEAVAPAELQQLGATSARRVTFTLPAQLPLGYFTIPVRIAAQQTGGDQPATEQDQGETEVTLLGKALRPLSVYGPDVDAEGVIHMGRLLQGLGKELTLLLKMRDAQTELIVQSIETHPAFLQVELQPLRVGQGRDVGLYRLHVTLPPDAPTFRLPPDQFGMIRIQFDHPRVPQLELPVDLIVVPRADATR